MRSKKQKKINKTEKSKKLSKLTKVKRIILENGFNGLLNNHKWHTIFERIDEKNIVFKIKLLIASEASFCDFIRELYETSILIDDSGKFIAFFEIEYIELNRSVGLIKFLDDNKIEYFKSEKSIKILGYNK